MLRRKIENTLEQWKSTSGHKPLVIMGIRQCGKTFIVQHFAAAHYKTVVYINFIKQPERINAFVGSKDVNVILLNLSAQIQGVSFTPGDTCFIFDEIQECPEARTSLKFFKEDGRFDVIATGSLLGVQGYGDEKKKQRCRLVELKEPGINSVPVGSEDIIEMYPLDFEEFLWANGLSEDVVETLRKCYREEKPVPAGIHVAMKQFLNLYVTIGGLPEPINVFLKTNNMNEVSKAYKSILKEYRDDMVKYAPDKDKPHIRECFNSIPKQLAKDNKKFQYNKVKPGGRSDTYLGSLQWLEDAGIICRCYNTDITGLPMEGNAKDNVFKVYTADIGLLVEMLGPGVRADILQGNLGGFKGAIYENLMADTLHKKEQNLYYFQKDSGMELDFLVRINGECVPLEVKAKTAQAKSVKTVLNHPEKYKVKHVIKFGDFNIGRDGQLLTLPNYMQFLLNLEPEEIVLESIDVDAVNALASEIIKE
ncbi:ATP-binding protein [Prevotella communis]|uniref:ATP-binding protein n=1 Tax=Prevotella communis TaxID=2913614 RepID=UPI001EDA5C1B|nr:ATP-binding protein [Prevotella communis]UKK59651.1 ATP-binding protein [Prevotella communis]UKK67632.1 ATP-binding protein [Prevotella communis]UKK70221.1 ATP-binding protein [Prevotella communis]